jgi:hypothetical protein
MAGYTRVDTINNIADGNVINAADLDGEFDGIQAAFNSSTGHNHDGTAGEGAPILALGPVQDVTISTTVLGVKTTNTVDLGTTGLRFKDFYLAGNASVGGTLGVTGATTLSAALTYGGVTLSNAVTGTGNMVLSASPTLTGTLGAAAATFSGAVALNGNTTLGDASSDTVTVNGTITSNLIFTDNTYDIGASGATRPRTGYFGTSVISPLVDATNLEVTNLKALDGTAAGSIANSTGVVTLASSVLTTTDINGGTIDGTAIGGSTAAAGAFTTLSSTGNTTLGDASADTVTVNGTTTFNASPIISVTDNTNAALRITQLGTGNALLVEDSTNPDSSPFVIDATGNVGIGTSSPVYQTQIYGTGQTTAALTDAGNKSGSLLLNTPTVSAGDGGALLIGASGSSAKPFAAIKGLLADGTSNTTGNLAFSTRNATADTALTERMRIDSSGNLLVGATTARSRLTVGTASSSPSAPTLGTASGAALFSNNAGTAEYGLMMGSASTGQGWIQQQRVDGTATAYDLWLQPSGGNVGIGVASPTATLDVSNSNGRNARIGGLQISGTSATADAGNNFVSSGAYWNGTNYTATATTSAITQYANGVLNFYTDSGLTAGNTFTASSRMTITSAGNVGIGTSSNAYNFVTGNSATTTGINQYSIGATATLSGTTFSASFLSQLNIPTGITADNAAALRIVNPTVSGTGAITNSYGIYMDDLTTGTNNYGITSLVSSGTNKWNIYASGTAANYFAGNVGIGTASPAQKLTVYSSTNDVEVLRINTDGGSGSVQAKADIGFGYYDGVAQANAAIGFEEFSASSTGGNLLFKTRPNGSAESTRPTERMRITSAGNVGMGTTSPQAALDLGDGTGGRAITWGGATGAARYASIFSTYGSASLAFGRGFTGSTSADSYVSTYTGTIANCGIRLDSAGFINFFTDASSSQTAGNAFTPTPRMRIDSSGNLLVGTTSAGVSNSLSTTIETSGANTSRITVNHSSIAGSSNGSYFMQFGYGGTLSGGIGQASTTTVNFYTGPSDRRLKNNIEDLDSSGEFIDALQPRKWTWTTNGEADVGFVADELQAVLPRCVNGEADAVDEEGNPVYQMVDASPPEMIANIVAELKAIRKREKEQQATIIQLQADVAALKTST